MHRFIIWFWDFIGHCHILPLLLNVHICTTWSLFSSVAVFTPHLLSPSLNHQHVPWLNSLITYCITHHLVFAIKFMIHFIGLIQGHNFSLKRGVYQFIRQVRCSLVPRWEGRRMVSLPIRIGGLVEHPELFQWGPEHSLSRKCFLYFNLHIGRLCWQQVTTNSSHFHPEKWGYSTPPSKKYQYPSYPYKLRLWPHLNQSALHSHLFANVSSSFSSSWVALSVTPEMFQIHVRFKLSCSQILPARLPSPTLGFFLDFSDFIFISSCYRL